MLQRTLAHLVHNKIVLGFVAGGVLLAGTKLIGCTDFFKVPDLGPSSARATDTSALSHTPAFHASVSGAQTAQSLGQVADAAGAIPSPIAPVASTVGNFSDAYAQELSRRLTVLEQKKDATPSDLLWAQLGAFAAGFGATLIRRAPTPTPATPEK